MHIIAIDGSQFGNGPDQIAGMAALGDLPIVQETAGQPVWTTWHAVWRDLMILDRNGKFLTNVNLTLFNPDPSVNSGKNFEQLKAILLAARNV